MEDTLAALKRGEARAFDAVYAQYRPRLYSFLLRLTRDRSLAEDLLQEMWLRLASHATRLAENTNLAAWLFTVARNLWVSHRRWNLLDADRLRAFGLRPGRTHENTSPLDLALASETQQRLERAIAALPPTYREVLLLIAVERFEPSEAAQMLGLKPDAARQRLARARAMVEKTLANPEPSHLQEGVAP